MEVADGLRKFSRPAMQSEDWLAVLGGLNLNIVEGHAAKPNTECLHRGLLGGEASGESLNGTTSTKNVAPLGTGKETLEQSGASKDYFAKPIDVNGIDANAGRAFAVGVRHSTVTVLARLRGRSTSKPFACAMA